MAQRYARHVTLSMLLLKMQELLPVQELLSFQGKTVLITGSSLGIGKATAARFAEAGANLLLLNRALPNPDEKSTLKSKGWIKHFAVDLAHKEEIDSFWRDLPDDAMPDVLVNNAGVYPIEDFTTVSEELLNTVMNVNMNSVFWMCQNFILRRKEQHKGGVIVNTSSIEAILPITKDMVHYSASKAGVIAITRSLARDYGREGFRVNVILPGGVMTEGTRSKQMDALIHLRFNLFKTGYDFNQRLASGRWGEPDDIAKVTLFLASDMAGYMNGALVPVDGGFLSS